MMPESAVTTTNSLNEVSFKICSCGSPDLHGYLVLDGDMQSKFPINIASKTIGRKILEYMIGTDEDKSRIEREMHEAGLPEVLLNQEEDEDLAKAAMSELFLNTLLGGARAK